MAGTERWLSRKYPLANLRAFCDQHFNGAAPIEVVDVLKHPERALSDGIVVTPTLVRVSPEPVQIAIGDLSDTRRVQAVLVIGEEGGNEAGA